MKERTLFEYYVMEEGLLKEEQLILEGKIFDMIKNVAGALSNRIKGVDVNVATQIINKVVKDKFSNIQQVTPRRRQVIDTVYNALPEVDPSSIIDLTASNPELSKYDSMILTKINQDLISSLGHWWEDHLITQAEFQNSIKSFQDNTISKTGKKVAAPINSMGTIGDIN